jgi:hypothetical protein
MPNTSKVLFLAIIVMCLTSCSSRFAEPEDVSSFCENIDLGTDFSAVLASLPSLGLELRKQTSQPSHDITQSLSNPHSIQTALITAEGLEQSNIDPACLIYFSSVLHQGDGKVVYKQFIGEVYKGNHS